MRAMLSQLDDGAPRPKGDDSIDPSMDLFDLPLSEAAMALKAAKGVPLAMASLKSPWQNLDRALKGGLSNPLRVSPKEYGKYAATLGNSVRNTGLELSGAHAIDEFKTRDAGQIVERLLRAEGAPPASFSYSPNLIRDHNALGMASPTNRKILQDPAAVKLPFFSNPDNLTAGIAQHEGLHLADPRLIKNPGAMIPPEVLFSRPMTNANIQLSGLTQEHRMNEFFQYLKNNPEEANQMPAYIQDQLKNFDRKRGASAFVQEAMLEVNPTYPRTGSKLQEKLSSQMNSSVGRTLRTMEGNGGFRGTNPWLMQNIRSAGHLPAPYSSDLAIAPYRLAKREIGAGGDDINNDWLKEFPSLISEKIKYKSSVRPGGKNFSGGSPWKGPKESPFGLDDYAAVAGGAGALGVAPMIAKDEKDNKTDKEFKRSVEALRKSRGDSRELRRPY